MKKTRIAGVLIALFGFGAVTSTVCTAYAADEPAAAENGWFTDSIDRRFYRNADGTLAVGTVEIDGLPYLFAPNGVQQLGWQNVNDLRYYYDQSGAPVFGWLTWRGENYYISKEHGKQTSPLVLAEGKAEFDSYGIAIQGWHQNEKKQWNYKNEHGISLIDCQITINDIVYSFDKNGVLQTGWQTYNGITRYYDPEIAVSQNGWITVDQNTYYVDAEKGRLTGRQTINKSQYLFDTNGIMQTGFQTIGNQKYYFNEDGALQTDWFESGDAKYHANTEGMLTVGLAEIEGKKYYFDEFGAMQTGIQSIDKAQYYFADDGVLQTGLSILDKTAYLADETGKLVTGWYTLNGAKYYCETAGIPVSGWKTVDTHTYYFYPETYNMAVSASIDSFIIDKNGLAVSENADKIDKLITKASGTTPKALFKYFTSIYKYSRNETTRTYDQITAAGWDTLVTYLLTYKRAVCYYLAAAFDLMCQRAGCTTRLVHATHSTGNHYWVQVYQNGSWHNYDPTYSSRNDISWSSQIALGNYTVLGYVKLKYDDRGALTDVTYTKYSK